MKRFTLEIPVLFQHCDPAGIMFYPRCFEFVNQTVELWFRDALGCGFAELHTRRGIGIPAVKIEAEFKKPAYLGETLEMELVLTELRNSAFAVVVRALVEGELRFRADTLHAFASLKPIKAVPIPDDLRQRMQSYLESGAAA
ncbi:MAG: thioesterase family protein [Rhodovibrionaceae bacterium]